MLLQNYFRRNSAFLSSFFLGVNLNICQQNCPSDAEEKKTGFSSKMEHVKGETSVSHL